MSRFDRKTANLTYSATYSVSDGLTRKRPWQLRKAYVVTHVTLFIDVGPRSNLNHDNLRFGAELYGSHDDGGAFRAEHVKASELPKDAGLLAWLEPIGTPFRAEVGRMLEAVRRG